MVSAWCLQLVSACLQAQVAQRRIGLLASSPWTAAPRCTACRLQEQLLESKARESKLHKEREGLDGVLSRCEAQRASLDAEATQMRRMLQDAGELG